MVHPFHAQYSKMDKHGQTNIPQNFESMFDHFFSVMHEIVKSAKLMHLKDTKVFGKIKFSNRRVNIQELHHLVYCKQVPYVKNVSF